MWVTLEFLTQWRESLWTLFILPPSTTCGLFWRASKLIENNFFLFFFFSGREENQNQPPKPTHMPEFAAKEKVELERTFPSLLSFWQLIYWSLIVIIHQVQAWRRILITAPCLSRGKTVYWVCCKVSSKFISIGSCNGSLLMGYFWIWCNGRK